jgi:hypothetical protein
MRITRPSVTIFSRHIFHSFYTLVSSVNVDSHILAVRRDGGAALRARQVCRLARSAQERGRCRRRGRRRPPCPGAGGSGARPTRGRRGGAMKMKMHVSVVLLAITVKYTHHNELERVLSPWHGLTVLAHTLKCHEFSSAWGASQTHSRPPCVSARTGRWAFRRARG